MKDYFLLLSFPRSPWLEPDEVNARFIELSSAAHPDKLHGAEASQLGAANQTFADLNAAAICLRDPRARLQHLLELEGINEKNAAQNVPAELIDLFTRVGQTCREVDRFLQERARATSPMMQAQLFASGLDWTDHLSELQQSVAQIKTAAEARLRQIQSAWPAEKPLEELRRLAHLFAATNRWESQLQERFASLAAG